MSEHISKSFAQPAAGHGRREPLRREVSKSLLLRGGLGYAYSPVAPAMSPSRLLARRMGAKRRQELNGSTPPPLETSIRRVVRRHPFETGFIAGVATTRGRTMTWQ